MQSTPDVSYALQSRGSRREAIGRKTHSPLLTLGYASGIAIGTALAVVGSQRQSATLVTIGLLALVLSFVLTRTTVTPNASTATRSRAATLSSTGYDYSNVSDLNAYRHLRGRTNPRSGRKTIFGESATITEIYCEKPSDGSDAV